MSRPLPHSLATTLLVVANALWGASYVVAKVALEEIPPPLLAALRFILAASVLWGVIGLRGRTRRLPPIRDTSRLLVLGLVGVSVSGMLQYLGISLTTATDAVLLIVGEVLFTTLLAVIVAGEHLGRLRSAGLVIGLLGVVILVVGAAGHESATAAARPLGDILILTGLAFEAVYTVLGTRLTRRYDPVTFLTLSFTGSCMVWLPVVAWYALQLGIGLPWRVCCTWR
ncbi:MAG: DMT family transporter [Chloroflexi bacterium]|nr:DMT family transporter [Chloroflexota bacterium]